MPFSPSKNYYTTPSGKTIYYTKDYYSILGLSAPSATHAITDAEVRRAYKFALLAAHPDTATGRAQGYTVDDVKEAWSILGDEKRREEYGRYVARNPSATRAAVRGEDGQQQQQQSSDFILGLELLDLSDFDVLDPGFAFSETDAKDDGATMGDAREEEGQMEWTRSCRCGRDKGFKILEEELEEAERRGEGEVLVGCEGCSLWVRVGFGVEEG